MNDQQAVIKGNRAREILNNPEWQAAWAAYRSRLLEIIEAADSTDAERVMHAKRLLVAGKAAQAHLERVLSDGVVAAKTIELEEKKRERERWFDRLRP